MGTMTAERDLTTRVPGRSSTWELRLRRREPVAAWAEERVQLHADAVLEAAAVWIRESLRRDGVLVDVEIARPDPLALELDLDAG